MGFSPFAQGLATLGGVLGLFLALSFLPTPPVVQALAQYVLFVILVPAYVLTIFMRFLLGRRRKGEGVRAAVYRPPPES